MSPKEMNQSLPWEVPGWNTEVEAWIAETLAAKDIKTTGPIREVQRRPWSVLLRASTPEGNFFVKVCSPVLQHEPGLTQALAGWSPENIIAADSDRSASRLDVDAGRRTHAAQPFRSRG